MVMRIFAACTFIADIKRIYKFVDILVYSSRIGQSTRSVFSRQTVDPHKQTWLCVHAERAREAFVPDLCMETEKPRWARPPAQPNFTRDRISSSHILFIVCCVPAPRDSILPTPSGSLEKFDTIPRILLGKVLIVSLLGWTPLLSCYSVLIRSKILWVVRFEDFVEWLEMNT